MFVNKMELLFPPFRAQVSGILTTARAAGIEVFAFETWRSWQRQEQLFYEKKTAACGGRSFHQYGLAVDLVPGGPGKWTWDWPHWAELGEIVRGAGVVWGGEFIPPDRPHCQLTTPMTINAIQSAADGGGVLYLWNILMEVKK